MLASLFHKRPVPTNQTDNNRQFTGEEIAAAQNSIRTNSPSIPNFDYQTLLNVVQNEQSMRNIYNETSNRYEKLQLYRLIKAKGDGEEQTPLHENSAIKKHINESFHIENELIVQLNPKKYDFVPEYVIKECDASLDASNHT